MPSLSDVQLRKLKPRDKPYKVADGEGLFVYVSTTGAKSWRFKYRVDGKEKVLTFGLYPDVTLASARRKCRDARQALAEDLDPGAERKRLKQERRAELATTFEHIARTWWEHWRHNRSDDHVSSTLRRLEADVFPLLGHRPIAAITTPEVARTIEHIGSRGVHDLAARLLQTVRAVFKFAAIRGIVTANPASDLRPSDILPRRVKANYARVDAKELSALLRAIEAYDSTVTRLATKLLALTFVRTGELIAAKWDEFDLEAARWDVPAGRMKMKVPHIVPLSRQAVTLLRTLYTLTGKGEYLFPNKRSPGEHMSNNTILGALKRMGYQGRMTGHGFRGVASTLLHEMGFAHKHIELQLAHQERDAVSAAYNYATHLPERAAMMQRWADHLDACLESSALAPKTKKELVNDATPTTAQDPSRLITGSLEGVAASA